jgi:Right handed beta helix region
MTASIWNPSTPVLSAEALEVLANTSDADQGDALIGVKRTETDAVAQTLHLWIQRSKFRAADFGVVADGITSDQLAMTNALAAIDAYGGGELELPIGTILLDTATLTIPENLTLTGQAWEVSKIKAGGAWPCLTKVYATHTDLNRLNLLARNLRFIGGATALGGVFIDKGDNCVFENCGFTDLQAANAYGLYLINTYWSNIIGCRFENIDKYGILMEAAAGVGCNASSIGGRTQFIGNNEPDFTCVVLNGQNLTISKTDMSGTGNGKCGIEIQNGEGIHIHDNYIERWTEAAIKATTGLPSSRIEIDNNVLNAGVTPVVDMNHASVNDNVLVHSNRFPDIAAGNCIRFGTTTNALEYNNSVGTANATDTYTTSQKAVAANRGTFTLTLTGVSGTVTSTAEYEKKGDEVLLTIPPTLGTSTATTATFTGLPTLITPTQDQNIPFFIRDNGVDSLAQLIISTTGVMTLCKVIGTAGGFTAAGQKGTLGQTFPYSLG